MLDMVSPLSIPGQSEDDLENRVLPRILRDRAERMGDRAFIDICGHTATFEEMQIVSARLARALRGLGVGASECVAMLLPNCFELVATWFAVSSIGAIEVPCNPSLKGDLLCHNLNTCGAGILVADVDTLEQIASVRDSLVNLHTLIVVGCDPAEARAAGIGIDRIVAFEECVAQRPDFDLAEIHWSDPMAILYTSGSTGPAKGALMSHHHCYSWASAMALNLGYGASDSYFSALPLFHTDAQMFGVYLPLIYGTRTTLVESFSASRFWDQVRASGATATNLLGAMAVILSRQAPSEADRSNPVRICQCIPMVPDKEAFERRYDMRLVTGYGQTETSFVTLDTAEEARSGSCGKPHPDWEVAIVDDRDRPLAPGFVGEIVARPRKSWNMFSGYYRADAQTLRTLRNLWYHSGDAGHLDEDGWLYFKHRLSEAIRRRGENISAFEVESIAEQHPDIVESAAFGIPSELTEEDIMIVAQRQAGSDLDAAALLEHFKSSAPRHMVPRYIEIADVALPRTPTEKIARAVLRAKGISPSTFDRGER